MNCFVSNAQEIEQNLFGFEKLIVPRAQVDYWTRIQTVDGEANPRYRLLVLVNTDPHAMYLARDDLKRRRPL
ncbi:MAG: hypothetical protein ACRED0_05410 [Gammaproteobacteria bacterium]